MKGVKGKYTDSRGESGEQLLVDWGGFVDGEQLKSTELDWVGYSVDVSRAELRAED